MTTKEKNMKERYPDTDNFKWYNANPYGVIGDDCVVRAISLVLNQTWIQTVQEMTVLGMKTGYVLNDQHCYEEYLKEKGFVKQKQPRTPNNKRYTIAEWGERTLFTGVAHAGSGHMVAVVDGVVYDIWNSSNEKIGNYWIKQG